MKIYSKKIALITIVAGATLSLVLVIGRDISTYASKGQGASRPDDVPELEYEKVAPASAAQRSEKHRRGLRQDRPIVELPAGIEPLPINLHSWVRLPALPVAESDAVILGEVTDRRVSLTDDKTGIYSAFSVCIETVYKDRQGLLASGGTVTASRPGGAVRFASGKVQRYTVSKQGYPHQGKRYVLFLKRDEEGDFSILTGYELRDAQVIPLDGDGSDPRSDLQFGVYRGITQASFFNDLWRAVQATGGVN